MRIIYAVLVCAMTFLMTATAQTAPSHLEAADSAYAADDFGYAIASYEEALRSEGSSPQLYYNLGNAYYRDGRPGKAIVAYERALRLDPTMTDARFNLKFVRSRLVDRQTTHISAFNSVLDSILSIAGSNTWAWTGAVLFITTIILIAIYMYTTPVTLRKIGFFGAAVALPLAVLCLLLAYVSANRSTSHTTAIITSPSVILSTAPRQPRDRNEEVALLHEGSALKLLDSLTNTTDSTASRVWYKVELDSDHKGWAPAAALEII